MNDDLITEIKEIINQIEEGLLSEDGDIALQSLLELIAELEAA